MLDSVVERNTPNFLGWSCRGRETEHSPPYSADVNDLWSHTSAPSYVLMAYFLVNAQGQPFTVVW